MTITDDAIVCRIITAAEATLMREIETLCDRIDQALNHKPGTAHKWCYFWHWPPGGQSFRTLGFLLADAKEELRRVTADTADTAGPADCDCRGDAP